MRKRKMASEIGCCSSKFMSYVVIIIIELVALIWWPLGWLNSCSHVPGPCRPSSPHQVWPSSRSHPRRYCHKQFVLVMASLLEQQWLLLSVFFFCCSFQYLIQLVRLIWLLTIWHGYEEPNITSVGCIQSKNFCLEF
ncbi:PREDICTED: uncharacterized protein LOC105125608 [Populus euphratica]|uniref:Uncharacterized protein LOC105125608 n=1 Tax=Populus euphratica TaxID=75702 RepID=A0AAJ6XMX2_POPEU|nr:PREDICTED: uncharacterized protein LOC105125608 [Populus euphratica]